MFLSMVLRFVQDSSCCSSMAPHWTLSYGSSLHSLLMKHFVWIIVKPIEFDENRSTLSSLLFFPDSRLFLVFISNNFHFFWWVSLNFEICFWKELFVNFLCLNNGGTFSTVFRWALRTRSSPTLILFFRMILKNIRVWDMDWKVSLLNLAFSIF